MKWESEARTLYRELVKHIPLPVKLIAAPSISRAAENGASNGGDKSVSREGLIEGIFEAVPQSYRARVVANLTAMGVDCNAYLNSGTRQATAQKDLMALWDSLIQIGEELQLPVNEERTRVALETFGPFFRKSPLIFRIESIPDAPPELSVRYLETLKPHMPDPLTTAVLKGFLDENASPSFLLFEEMKLSFDILGYGVNLDVNHGITKLSAALNPVSIDSLSELAHLPGSLKKNAMHLKKYGLTRIAMFEVDFCRQGFHIFIMIKEPSRTGSAEYRRLLGDLQLMRVSDETLNHCAGAHVASFAFDWHSDRVTHATFATLYHNIGNFPAHRDSVVAASHKSQVFFPPGNQAIFSTIISESSVGFSIDSDFGGAMTAEILKATQAGV